MDRTEAFEILSATHVYLTVEGANLVADAFGVPHAPVEHHPANTGDPKGLMVAGVRPGTRVEGVSSENLAEHIAAQLDVEDKSYQNYLGRGFRQRAAVEAIRAHLAKEGSDVTG